MIFFDPQKPIELISSVYWTRSFRTGSNSVQRLHQPQPNGTDSCQPVFIGMAFVLTYFSLHQTKADWERAFVKLKSGFFRVFPVIGAANCETIKSLCDFGAPDGGNVFAERYN